MPRSYVGVAFTDWLRERAVPLAHLDPQAPLDDLEPLRGIVGELGPLPDGLAVLGGSSDSECGTGNAFGYPRRRRAAPRAAPSLTGAVTTERSRGSGT